MSDIEQHPIPFCFERYDDFLGFVVSQSGNLLAKTLAKAIKKVNYKITPREFAILNRLNQHGSLNQSELAQMTFKDRPATTRMLDKLEKLGYVKRSVNKDDRRVFDISLTKTGSQVRSKIVPLAVTMIEEGCKDISRKDLHVTLRTLQKLNANISR